MLKQLVSGIMLLICVFAMIPIRNVLATSPVHFYCTALAKGDYGSITMAGTTYQSGQTANYNEVDYWITGNPPAPTSDWFFDYWSVMYIGGRSWVDNQYAQSTWFHLRGEAYLWAYFYSPIHTNNPTSPITWGTKQRITGTGTQWSGKQLSVVYCTQGGGMGPPNRNGVPPFGSGNNGYLWATVSVNSGAWDTGYIYPTLPISQNQQLPQTYDVYALWGSDPSEEVDSNVVSFTLNPATPQIAAPTLTPASIQQGQSVTITDEIFSSAFVNSNDLAGTLTVQARKQGTTSWTDVASQQFTSNYGYSTIYGQYGDYYDLSTSWTPPEAASYDVRIVYSGNHYFVPVNSPSSPLTVSQTTYNVALYAHCNTESADVSVAIAQDSSPTGFNTPHTFTGLTGTHTFTVPNTDPSGHQFKQWSTNATTTTITVSGSGTYTAYYEQPPPTYQFTVIAHCNTESSDISVNMVLDDSPPGYPTPYSFTSTIATHKFTVPGTDSSDHPFKQWSTGETSTSLTVSSAGTYTAFYGVTQHKLTVSSAHDSPNPPNGDNYRDDGSSVTCSVTSPVTEGGTVWTCTGWTGTGSVPASGTGSSTGPFTITQDSSITWNWHGNSPPALPQFINWPTFLGQNVQGTWYASAKDPDNDLVSITFDWDDGSQTTVGPGSSDSTQTGQHPYSHTGMYQVKAMATDAYDAQSGWSTPVEVTVLSVNSAGIWGGYMVESPSQSITSVEGRWYVPTFGTQKYSENGIWVGIGGNGPYTSLLQAGVEAVTYPDTGTTHYRAFMETISLHFGLGPVFDDPSKSGCWIFAGDAMDVSINQLSTGNWNVQITDLTRGWTLTWPSVTWLLPNQTTAEWIFEPGVGNTNLPSSFGTIAFGSATLGIGSTVYELGQAGHNLNTGLYNCTCVRNNVAVTSISPIDNYKNFDISDTGRRPTSQSLVPITSLSLHSSAELHVYDSFGNHLGYNSTTGLIDNQIPNSFYFEEDGVQYALLFGADTYHVSVVGVQNGEYHLRTQIISNETATLDQWVNDTITTGETKSYSIIHEISTENLVSSKTTVGKGYICSINIEVANNGNYTETFNVTAYANATVIGTQLVTLANRNSTTLVFRWDTTGFAEGNYTMSAFAEPVLGETNTTDNICVGGCLLVSIPGDVDGDFENGHYDVDLYDAVRLLVCYGLKQSESGFDINCDIDNDGRVTLFDAVILMSHYGQSYP